MKVITCPHCGSNDIVMQWQKFGNGTRHIRASCANPRCGRFLQFVPKEPAATDRANQGGEWSGDSPKSPPEGAPRQRSLFEDEPV